MIKNLFLLAILGILSLPVVSSAELHSYARYSTDGMKTMRDLGPGEGHTYNKLDYNIPLIQKDKPSNSFGSIVTSFTKAPLSKTKSGGCKQAAHSKSRSAWQPARYFGPHNSKTNKNKPDSNPLQAIGGLLNSKLLTSVSSFL